MPLSMKSTIEVPDPTATNERMDLPGPLVAEGICSTVSPPIVPSNTAASMISSLVERVLKPTALDTGELSERMMAFLRAWALNPVNFEQMGFTKDCVKPLSFEEWNLRFPASQQQVHIGAKRDLESGNFVPHRINERGGFYKSEKLMKAGLEGPSSYSPRCIQSGTPHHNVLTGPFTVAFADYLSQVAWSVKNGSGLIYTSKASSEELGAAVTAGLDRCASAAVLEGDYNRFDTTIHELWLKFEADFYKACGASDSVYRSFLAGITKKGRGKFNIKYKVRGGRCSGDPQTSCGNTLIQGIALVFCFVIWDLYLQEQAGKQPVLATYKDIVSRYNLTSLLLGDDNYTVVEQSMADGMPLVEIMRMLGLDLDLKIHIGPAAPYTATFCSARFYPTDDGLVLAPPIGRGLCKSGWYIIDPTQPEPNVRGMLRADAISRSRDCAHVPFLREYWRRTAELTQGTQAVFNREMKRTALHNAHTVVSHQANEATWDMVREVYDLTPADEAEYAKALNSITELPCVLDRIWMERAAKIDGMIKEDDDATCPLVSTLPGNKECPFDELWAVEALSPHFELRDAMFGFIATHRGFPELCFLPWQAPSLGCVNNCKLCYCPRSNPKLEDPSTSVAADSPSWDPSSTRDSTFVYSNEHLW